MRKNDLFELINSLTKSEKRYFKVYSARHKQENTYVKLFCAVEKQKLYDEKTLKHTFRKEKFVNNFAVAKSYLYKQVILSIKNHGAYKDIDSEHSGLIESFKILEYKGLTGQSLQFLEKAAAVAAEDEGFLRLYYILNKKYIALLLSTEFASMKEVGALISKRKMVLSQIENYSFIADILYLQRRFLRVRSYCRTQKEKADLKKIISPLLGMKKEKLLSHTALGLYTTAISEYYNAVGQPMKAITLSHNYLKVKNTGDPNKIEVQTINELSSYLMLCLRNGYYKDYHFHLENFKSRMSDLRNTTRYVLLFERWFLFQLAYHNSHKDFSAGIKLIEKEGYALDKYGKLISKKGKMSLYYAIAYAYFGIGQYKQALSWLNEIINEKDEKIEEYSFARILSVLIHFDLGYNELLEYSVRSAYRHLLSRQRLYRSEKLILNFLKNNLIVTDPETMRPRFALLKKQLELNFRDPVERNILYYCDFPGWLESKISGNSFALSKGYKI